MSGCRQLGGPLAVRDAIHPWAAAAATATAPSCLLGPALDSSLRLVAQKKIQCMSQLITAVRNTGSTNHTGKHRTALSQAASMAFKQSTTLPPDCIAACRASYSLEYLRSRLAAW